MVALTGLSALGVGWYVPGDYSHRDELMGAEILKLLKEKVPTPCKGTEHNHDAEGV